MAHDSHRKHITGVLLPKVCLPECFIQHKIVNILSGIGLTIASVIVSEQLGKAVDEQITNTSFRE